MVDKSERDLERRGGAGDETARKHKRKLFRQKVRGALYCALSVWNFENIFSGQTSDQLLDCGSTEKIQLNFL